MESEKKSLFEEEDREENASTIPKSPVRLTLAGFGGRDGFAVRGLGGFGGGQGFSEGAVDATSGVGITASFVGCSFVFCGTCVSERGVDS